MSIKPSLWRLLSGGKFLAGMGRLSCLVAIGGFLWLTAVGQNASAATQVFKWDVENGAISNYFNAWVHAASIVSTARAHSGTKSIFYDPTLPTGGDLSVKAPYSFAGSGGNFVNWPSKTPQIYVRWWWWIPATIAGGASGNHGWRITEYPWGDHFHTVDTDHGTKTATTLGWGVVNFDTDAPGGFFEESHQNKWNVPLGQWFEHAIYLKLNTVGSANGVMTIWVNGSVVYNRTDVTYRGHSSYAGWDTLRVNTNMDNPGPSGASYWYIDDIEIWDGIPTGGVNLPPAPNMKPPQ